MKRPPVEQLLLLDTNVWSYISQAERVEDVRRAAKSSSWRIAVAPGVVHEILRTPKAEYRNRDIEVVTRGSWVRLMPEIYWETEELVGEVRRLRPEWLLESPDRRTWVKFESDWSSSRGFWRRVRQHPEREAAAIAALEGGLLDQARAQNRDLKASVEGVAFDKVNLNAMTARPAQHINGWNGTDVEPWRMDSMAVWSLGVFGRSQSGYDTPYREWLTPWVNLPAIQRERSRWVTFWLHDVERDQMPRHWIRWAAALLQATRKSSGGVPVDNQITSYLPDCRYVITADKVFSEIVHKLRSASTRPLAEEYLVPGNESAVDELIGFISDTHPARD